MGFFGTIKSFYRYAKPFRGKIFLGLGCLFLLDLLNVVPPLVLKSFIDQSEKAFKGDRAYLPFLWIGLAYTSIALIQGMFRYLWRIFLIKSSHRIAERIREDYFQKLQKLPPSFYDRYSVGDLVALASNDVEAIRFAIGPGLLVFADALFLLIAMPPAMYMLSHKLTWVTLLPLLFLPLFIAWAESRVHHRFQKVQEQFSKLNSFAQENIEGIRIIKAFMREWTQLKRFAGIGKEFVRLNLKLARVQSLFEPVFALGLGIGLVSLVYFSAPMVIRGEIELGTFVAFTRYLDQLIWPLSAFGFAVTYYLRGKGSLERIFTVLAEEEESDVTQTIAQKTNQLFVATKNNPLLEIRNLSFSYPNGSVALKNISLRIEEGQWTALVGSIGSGKSTLIKLLTGQYPLPAGTVYLRGVDLTEVPLYERRRMFALVPQEVFLFSDTLGRNIFLGDESKSLDVIDHEDPQTSQAFQQVMVRAELEGFISTGLNKPISEKGSNLSGGEKARVTMARAFVRNAPILILDDALSSVDSATENRILNSLFEHQSEMQSLLMITHRFSRLWKFDHIYLFHKGELMQQGTPQELAKQPGMYRSLLELHHMEESLV